jgi:hypothetical protein
VLVPLSHVEREHIAHVQLGRSLREIDLPWQKKINRARAAELFVHSKLEQDPEVELPRLFAKPSLTDTRGKAGRE